MIESTGIDCIDKLVRSIERASGAKLTRDDEASKKDTDVKCCMVGKTGYEVLKYQNAYGNTERLGIDYNVTTNRQGKLLKEEAELRLLDISAGDKRVVAYLSSVKDKITNKPDKRPKVLRSGGLVGNTDDSLGLALPLKYTLTLGFKQRQTTVELQQQFQIHGRSLSAWLVIPNVQKGLNYSTREFLRYVMTSNAR